MTITHDFDISLLTNEQIWLLYSKLRAELGKRNMTRTGNIIGERGEELTINLYNNTKGLMKLLAAPKLAKNVDALGRQGERYSIKTITGKTVNTGKFFGLGNESQPPQKFEYLIIAILNAELQLKMVLEISWQQFLKLRRFDGGLWSITVNRKLLSEAKIVYKSPRLEAVTDWRKIL